MRSVRRGEPTSEYLQGYRRTRLGIGKCIVMLAQVVSALGCDRRKFMIREIRERPSRRPARTEKLITRPAQPIQIIYCPQASFVKWAVVCHERQAEYLRRNLAPHIGKIRRIGRIFVTHTVYLGREPRVEIRARTYKPVYRTRDLTVFDHDQPDAAYAAAITVSGLEIYGGKIQHMFVFQWTNITKVSENMSRTHHYRVFQP